MSDTFSEDKILKKKCFPFKIKRVLEKYPSLTERYYNPKLFVPKEPYCSLEHPVGDQCILFHSNKICLVTLAPSHPAIKEKKHITKVEFVQKSLDNKVTGKQKKGGQKLKTNTILCKIFCDDNSIYTVLACIKSSLIEINKNLIGNPNLIVSSTWSNGYIAILLPYINQIDRDNKLLIDFDNNLNNEEQNK